MNFFDNFSKLELLAFDITEFILFLVIDVIIIVLAAKGYKKKESKNAWLLLLILESIAIVMSIISYYFIIMHHLGLYSTTEIAQHTVWNILISKIHSYISTIVFVIMVWCFYKKK